MSAEDEGGTAPTDTYRVENPYEDMDPDDINHVHSINYDEMANLINKLPPGWIRLAPDDMAEGNQSRPPYLHEPTGETSWKNPNLRRIMNIVDEGHQTQLSKRKEEGGYDPKQVKKLRLMLQAGAPLGAVEQRAKMEGIDMSHVLSPSSSEEEAKKKDDARMVVSDTEEDATSAEKKKADIPETLVKKYKRMWKAGTPLGAVQQLAGRETGASPEEVEAILQGGENEGAVVDPSALVNTRMAKFVRMQKAGIPLIAIQNAARLQGHDMDELNEALGVKDPNNEDKAGGEKAKKAEPSAGVNPRMAKFVNMQKAGIPLAAIQNAARLQGHDMNELNEALGVKDPNNKEGGRKDEPSVAKSVGKAPSLTAKPAKTSPSNETTTSQFTIQKGKLSFPCSRHGEHKFPLTDLVRKMVQTVQKTSRFAMGLSNNEMVVDDDTLFHALGAMKGVKFARDEYNSTIIVGGKVGGVDTMDEGWIHSKRHGYLEMASSIGMTLPHNDNDAVDIEGLEDLIRHIEFVHRDELKSVDSLLQDGYYCFDSLHTLYSPGSYVIAKHGGGGGIDCVCQVVWHRYTQGTTISGKPMKYFQLCVRFIVPVGQGKSTFAEVVDGIEMFEGSRSLSASASGAGLAFVPTVTGDNHKTDFLHGFNLRGEVYNRVIAHGNNGEEKTHRYMEYEKGCFFQKRGGGSFNSGKSSVALATSGRIVVDFDAASEYGHSIGIGRDDMLDGIRMKLKEYKLHLRSMDAHSHGNDAAGHAKGGSSSGVMILFNQIPKEYLPLVWPTAIGFSLTSKSWGDVIIDGLKDIAFDPTVFELLVLPQSRKRMIKALVKHSSNGFHDLVQGKGEGTCFLLHGQPGTGKTLTAEAIAEYLHCPLYSISMGTLGTTAEELERRLSEILQLSARWNSLVLLDEADSFLEARSSNSPLERNAMVSVMLRLVEYHRGILFLTSNRIESLDPAFQTRITLALKYEPLDAEGRAKVWKNLLVKSGESIDMLDLPSLAKTVLNGREIKNALRLAMALAADEGCALSQDLLLETAEVVNGQHSKEEEKEEPRGWLSSCWA